MAYIKAYSDENKRHPDLFHAGVSDELVVERLSSLFAHFRLPVIPAKFDKRNGGASFHHRGTHTAIEFRFTPGKASLLTLAHEFAHYITFEDRKAAIAKLQAEIDKLMRKAADAYDAGNDAVGDAANAGKKRLVEKREAIVGRGGHTADFVQNVNRVCMYIREQGWHVDAPRINDAWQMEKIATQAAAPAPEGVPQKDLVARYFERLPSFLFCPKCERDKSKEDFGVRVMSRYVDGTPREVKRQSYCRKCRSAK